MKRITLPAWAAQHWDPAPSQRTLERWTRDGRILPAPQKVGRAYYVLPTARYVDRDGVPTSIDAAAWVRSGAAPKAIPIEPRQQPVALSIDEMRACAEPTAEAGVYFLWLGKKLQYVGTSGSMCERINAHRAMMAIDYDRVTCVEVLPRPLFNHYRFRLELEREYIRVYRPPFNHQQYGRAAR